MHTDVSLIKFEWYVTSKKFVFLQAFLYIYKKYVCIYVVSSVRVLRPEKGCMKFLSQVEFIEYEFITDCFADK